jgi:hypothetical protein
MDRRTASSGETLKPHCFAGAVEPPARDYTVFAHVLQPPQTKWAGWINKPVPPTRASPAGGQRHVPVDARSATPPAYEIEVGGITFGGASLERLKVVTRDGRQQQDYVLSARCAVK